MVLREKRLLGCHCCTPQNSPIRRGGEEEGGGRKGGQEYVEEMSEIHREKKLKKRI